MTRPAFSISGREQPATKVCRRCNRELPNTDEHFYVERVEATGEVWRRGKCKPCYNAIQSAGRKKVRAAARAVEAQSRGAFVPRIVGADGEPEGGFSEYPTEGYRYVNIPDTHGDKCDWPAIEATLAFVRWYKPHVIHLLGDHVDFEQFGRFLNAPDRATQVVDDIEACKKFLRKVRESARDARMVYLKGNHEDRYRRYLWSNAAALVKMRGMDVPTALGLSEVGAEWVESGTHVVNDALIVRHGRVVRKKSAYTATAEMERNGVSGASGHTHRLGVHYHTSRNGVSVWMESGCLCDLNPSYMEGDVADWQHGLTFGSVSLTSHRFAMHQAPILNGRVLLADREIGP